VAIARCCATSLLPRLLTSLLPSQELGDARPDVQDAVVKLCVAWWVAGADSREYLVSQALPYLLVRSRAVHCGIWRAQLSQLLRNAHGWGGGEGHTRGGMQYIV
jgi:hypothetical protein